MDAVLARLDAPPGAWAFALRIWLAMVLALLVAFWLQLDSASSAAVCVAILAQPKRGQALSKAFYRFLATWLGFGVSILLAGAFGQDRVLMLVGSSVWLGLCVFVGNYLQGTQAYGAVLSGYTVAIIAISNIDTPLSVFMTGIDRVAAITVGIVSIALINDALAAPDTYPTVRDQIREAWNATRSFAQDALTRGPPAPDATGALIQQIAGPRTDIAAVAGEFSDGVDRAAGARSAVAGLFAEVAAVRAFTRAAAYAGVDPAEVEALRARVRAGLSGDADALSDLTVRAGEAVIDPASTPERVLLHRRAADILFQDDLVADGMRALEGGGPPRRQVILPVHRDFPDALRNTIRVVSAYALCAACLIPLGWPATSVTLTQVAVIATFSSIAPSPRAFAFGAATAMPVAVLCVGVIKFFVLNGNQAFPLLTIALLPVVVSSCFLLQRPKTSTVGFILLVFFNIIFVPANPQSYDPQDYVNTSVFSLIATVFVFACVLTLLPTRDSRRRRWSLQSARADILEALRGEPKEAWERINLDSDRLAQFAGQPVRSAVARRAGLRHALALANLDAAAAGAQAALNRLVRRPSYDAAIRDARGSLARLDTAGLRAAAAAMIRTAGEDPQADRHVVSLAVADLAAAAHLIREEGGILRRLGIKAAPGTSS